ncbi:hypothetical protein CBL_10027 [Carabus blaptoides fortunei]
MAPPFGPNDILKISDLLNMMKADETSLVAKKDNIICEVARRYIKSHREKHQLLVAKRYMRRLARLVIAVRKNLNNVSLNLIDLLSPHSFKDLIVGSKAIAEYDEKDRVSKSPSLALQMGTLLKQATNTTISHEMQKGKQYFSQERLHYLQTLISLIETDWALEISSDAGQNLQINKFNKPALIPIAEDIKIFDTYLNDLIKNAKIGLAENSGNLMSYEKEQEELKTLYDLFCAKSDNELEEGDRYSESEPEEFQDDGEFNGDPDFVPVEDMKPIIDFDFNTKNSGPIDMDTSSRINIFKKMFSDEVLDMLVTSTNIYGEKLCQLNRPSTRNRRILSFKRTNILKMSQFLGPCLLKSEVRALSIRHLFSKAPETDGKTSSIVKRLMAPYLNRGHHMYMDNFNNSVSLSKELLELKTHTTGTLRRNQKENPKVVVNQKLKRGEDIWRRSGDVYVSKWHDKRDVIVISTANHPELIEVRNRFNNLKVKPRPVRAYNENMSSVNRCDQMVEYYSSPRKTVRWKRKPNYHTADEIKKDRLGHWPKLTDIKTARCHSAACHRKTYHTPFSTFPLVNRTWQPVIAACSF